MPSTPCEEARVDEAEVAAPSTPYGETRVDVVEMAMPDTHAGLAVALNEVVALYEAGSRLLVGPPQVIPTLVDSGDGEVRKVIWVVVTTKAGPLHPRTFPGPPGTLS